VSSPRGSGWARMAVVYAVVVLVDQAAKGAIVETLAKGERVDLVLGFKLAHVTNSGIAFGMLDDAGEGLVLAITLATLALVVGWFASDPGRPGLWLGVGLLAGGAIGNLIDRIRLDAVTDFIDPPAWPAFNLADVAITAGVAVLVFTAFAAPADAATDP
jgi:signal peptidase II